MIFWRGDVTGTNIFSYLFFQRLINIDKHEGTEYLNLTGISEEDRLLLASSIQTKNALAREKVVIDFFDLLCDEPSLAFLSQTDPTHGRVFYRVLKGPKDTRKRRVLDHALKFYALHRLRQSNGRPYQCSTFNGRLKFLFADFRYNGIEFSRTMDFNGVGSVGHTIKAFWGRPSSGGSNGRDDLGMVKHNRPPLPDDYDEIIYDRVVKRSMMDISGTDNQRDLLAIIAMKLCTQGGMRGQQVR